MWAGEPAGALATRRDRVRFAGAGSPASATVAASTAAATSPATVVSAAAGAPAGPLADRRVLVRFTGADGSADPWDASAAGSARAPVAGSPGASAPAWAAPAWAAPAWAAPAWAAPAWAAPSLGGPSLGGGSPSGAPACAEPSPALPSRSAGRSTGPRRRWAGSGRWGRAMWSRRSLPAGAWSGPGSPLEGCVRRRRGSRSPSAPVGSLSSIRLSPFRLPGAHDHARDRTGAVCDGTYPRTVSAPPSLRCLPGRPVLGQPEGVEPTDGTACSSGRGPPAASVAGMSAARSGASGSVSRPPPSSRPCANRVARGGTAGTKPATARSAASTSSGRTAGVTCRTTSSSIAQPSWPGAADALAPTTAARASSCRRPAFVSRSTSTRSAARKASSAAASVGRRHAGQLDPPGRGVDPVGQRVRRRAGPRRTPARPARPAGTRPAPPAADRRRRREASPISRYSASLATPVGAAADVGDLRVRGEAGRVGHRDAGPAQRPLERPGEVAVRGEAQPAALGVPHPHPLHDRRWRRTLRLPRHPHPARPSRSHRSPTRTGGSATRRERRAHRRHRQQRLAGRPDLDLGAHPRADPAVEARRPAAVVLLLLGQGVLPVGPEPLLVQPGVEVVPGQHLVLAALPGRVPVRRRRADRRGRRPSSGRTRSARSSRRTGRRPPRPGGSPRPPAGRRGRAGPR